MNILFKGIDAIPMHGEKILYGTCVAVQGGKIAHVGDEPPGFRADRVINGEGKLILPGLVNCHAHSPMSLLRGYASDLNLHDWLFGYIFPAEAKYQEGMAYAGALVSAAEMLSNGVVSFSDMYFNLDGIARAVDESGMKANLSNGMTAFSEGFDYHKDRSCTETEGILKNYHNQAGGRVKADASIHAEFTSFGGAWRQVAAFAKENGLVMHTHVSETRHEHEECKKKYGMTPAQVLDKHGVFDTKAIAAHCVWAENEDIQIFKRKGVTVAHCPASNLKLASGVAPVARFLQEGVNVALGTDGASSNNSQDLLADLKIASLLQKYATNDPTALPAYEALKLATANGAAAQGREDEMGRILPGLDADLVVLDLNTPRNAAAIDPVAAAVYSCTGRDVEMTMCKGQVLYEKGEFKTIDVEKAVFEAKQAVKRLGILG